MKIQNTKLNCICKTFDLKLLDKGLFIWTIGTTMISPSSVYSTKQNHCTVSLALPIALFYHYHHFTNFVFQKYAKEGNTNYNYNSKFPNFNINLT